MEANPYQTPQGEFLLQATPSEAGGFYVVGKKKMLVLSFATLGMYWVYWFYRNWRLRKQLTGESIWPVPRAIFSVFFVHALFRAANGQRDPGLPVWNHTLHATITVIMLFTSNVVDRLSSKSIGSPVTDILSLLLLIPTAACLVAAQEKINEACGDPTGESNSRFTGANYVWLVLGVILWILIIIGLSMPEVETME